MQIPTHPYTRLLKPMQIASKESLNPSKIHQKCLKPMRIALNSNVLARICCYVHCFKGFLIFLLVFAWVLRWNPLKPMQIPILPYTRLLKPMQIAMKTSLEPMNTYKKHLKPTRIAAKITRQAHRTHTHVDPSSREAQR